MKWSLSFCFLILLAFVACRQSYEPPAVQSANHYLVVEGIINATQDGTTKIILSRTRNFADSLTPSPENNAQVQVQARTGPVYTLLAQGNGVYTLEHMSLNHQDEYRLNITTSNGRSYASDYVPVKETPPIDSLSWLQHNDVTIYASTHDPQNKARYYRWDYVETWQYRSTLESVWGVSNHLIFYRDTAFQVRNCWSTLSSNNIALANSVNLSQDIITRAPIAVIPQNSEKLGVRYSILASEYALTEDAYRFWQILERNSEQMGSLFDPQPSQLKGNIHPTSAPDEPVIGYISASTVTRQRMFIDRIDITNWNVNMSTNCDTLSIPVNPSNFLIYTYPDTTYVPYYFITGGPLIIIHAPCVDCTLHGGTNKKPLFW
jgi:hypothetical protein